MPQPTEAAGDSPTVTPLTRELLAPVAERPGNSYSHSHRLGRWRIQLSRAVEHPLLRITVIFAAPLVTFLILAWSPISPLLRMLVPSGESLPPTPMLLPWVALLGSSQILSFRGFGLFYPIAKTTIWRLMARVWFGSALGCAVIVVTGFAWGQMPVPRVMLPAFTALNCALLTFAFLVIQRLERRRPERILLLGPWRVTDYFLRALQTLPSRKHFIVPSKDAGVHSGPLETVEDFREIFSNHRVDRVYLVKSAFSDEQVLRLLEIKPRHVHVHVVPSTWDSMISRLALGPVIGDLRMVEIRTPLAEPFENFLKRLVDVSLALVLTVLTLPLQLGIAAAILLTDGGPVLYCQRRVGRHGRTFEILKFRTMIRDSEPAGQPRLVSENDHRVTRIGRHLRRCRLDELPQLWNVLRGEMALVGPRPERPYFVDTYQTEIPGYALRHEVRPGITGIAQVYGKYQSHPREKLRFDLAYIFNYSLMLDLTILVKTAWLLIAGLFSKA